MKTASKRAVTTEYFVTITIAVLSLVFASWLMVSTFFYDSESGNILLGTRLWSDFGAHIPLIRSFSRGDNLDRIFEAKMPEYPLFPGEPIRYHFIFFAFAGWLERLGLRIDWALNIPSIAGFSLLMFLAYYIPYKIFRDFRVAVLSLIFFIFNGSLSFIRFFEIHPLSVGSLGSILQAREFPSFAPWGPGDITAFWNMNIYTNQRHLALAFGLGLGFIASLVRMSRRSVKKQVPFAILWGCIGGIMPFLHQPTLFIMSIVGLTYFVLFKNLRVSLLVTAAITGGLVFMQFPALQTGSGSFSFYPGYLAHDVLTGPLPPLNKVVAFAWYWFQNLGGHLILAPLGYLIANNRIKKIFAPLILLFLIPNLFRFSVEVAASHKFFNFFLILASMLSAYTLIHMFDFLRKRKNIILKSSAYLLICIFVVLLTLSGIIDLTVVANDNRGTLTDTVSNPVAAWIQNNTPKNGVFLNSSWFFNPASLAGRKIILGWPYFAWSAGYDTVARLEDQTLMLKGEDPAIVCNLILKHNIGYILTENPPPQTELPINYEFFDTHFPLIFETQYGSTYFKLYSTRQMCKT